MGFNIETERLFLKLAVSEDLKDIHYLHSFPEVDQYNTLGIPDSLEHTIATMEPFLAANITGVKMTFIVKDKISNKFIGMVGIVPGKVKYRSAEVWYKIVPEEWGKGYATELLKALILFCFTTLNAHRVEAGCAVDNIASVKVLEKAGMQLEGRRRQTLPLANGWSDNFEYAILDIDETIK